MATGIVIGTLAGVTEDGVLIIDLRGQQRKFPLGCNLSLEWVYSHMEKKVTCFLDDEKVIRIE